MRIASRIANLEWIEAICSKSIGNAPTDHAETPETWVKCNAFFVQNKGNNSDSSKIWTQITSNLKTYTTNAAF